MSKNIILQSVKTFVMSFKHKITEEAYLYLIHSDSGSKTRFLVFCVFFKTESAELNVTGVTLGFVTFFWLQEKKIPAAM